MQQIEGNGRRQHSREESRMERLFILRKGASHTKQRPERVWADLGSRGKEAL